MKKNVSEEEEEVNVYVCTSTICSHDENVFFFIHSIEKFRVRKMLIDKELFRGRIDHIADRKLTSVRIFISSTFTGRVVRRKYFQPMNSIFIRIDTTEERDALIQSVYPKLREYCRQKYKIAFQVCYIPAWRFCIDGHHCSILICDGVFKKRPPMIIRPRICVCMN